MVFEGVVDRSGPALGRREVAQEVDIGSRDEGLHRFLGGVGNASELWSGDQVEQCLFDRGDPPCAEFGLVALEVEV